MRANLARFFSLLLVLVCVIVSGCAVSQDTADTASTIDFGAEASGKTITSTQVETLIAAGRAQLGTPNSNCKVWVQTITPAALGSSYSIPATASNSYSWASSSVVTNKAQWVGSYTNGRLTNSSSLVRGSSISTTFSESYANPQVIVLYASATGVTATASKGSTSISVTSSGSAPAGGTLSSVSTATSTGTWTLTVTNNSSGSIATSGINAVVLSNSRFTSDWQTARRGDIIQMYGGTSSSTRGTGGPHTTFVQVNYNAGTNWLDANWVENTSHVRVVGEHAVSMSDMMKMVAYSTSYGFTVYRIN